VVEEIAQVIAAEKLEPGFVDDIWMRLDAALSPQAETQFAAFANIHNVKKWVIATDFCIRDQIRPNDTFAFVVFPAGEKWAGTTELVAASPKTILRA
jgi:hypothetical protein